VTKFGLLGRKYNRSCFQHASPISKIYKIDFSYKD
jgi:hypothetical protein